MAHAILPHENDISFGQAYAVLNLDWMTCLIDSIKDTSVGQEFIASCSQWNDAVHQKVPRPLNIFTTLTFSTHSQPELAPDSHFAGLIKDYGTFERGLRAVQIDDNFVTDDEDIILQKTRWYAGSGNSLEQILRAQKIETVVISGLSLSGVVMSTVYRLFDLDYNIYVISDNVLDLPPEHPSALLDHIFPKMKVKAISIDDALKALGRS